MYVHHFLSSHNQYNSLKSIVLSTFPMQNFSLNREILGIIINLMSAKVAVTMGFALPWVADSKLLSALPSHPFSFNSERKWGKERRQGQAPAPHGLNSPSPLT
jgi:hypothetical protein